MLKKLGNNETELTVKGRKVLFSYNTPVAVKDNGEFLKTSKKWNVTTSKHINRWLPREASVKEVDQSIIEGMVN